MSYDPLIRYDVRIPGKDTVASAASFEKAVRLAAARDRTDGPCPGAFRVYGVHRSGAVTGPYDPRR